MPDVSPACFFCVAGSSAGTVRNELRYERFNFSWPWMWDVGSWIVALRMSRICDVVVNGSGVTSVIVFAMQTHVGSASCRVKGGDCDNGVLSWQLLC